MSEDFASLRIRIESLEARVAKERLEHLERQGRSTERATIGLRRAFLGLGTAIGAALSVRQVVRYADEMTSLTNQLKLVTDSNEDLIRTQERLQALANGTFSDIRSTTELYAKMYRATADLGIGQSDLLKVTEAVNKSFLISGASSAEAAGSIRQLAQALASGAFRGDEFNSVAEGAPRLMQALAEETGNTVGELRALAAEGKLTSEVLINALVNQADTISTEFEQLAPTIEQATTVATNNLKILVREADEATGASESFAQTILEVADILNDFTVRIESGELEAQLDAISDKFDGLAEDFAFTLDAIDAIFGTYIERMKKVAPEYVDTFVQAMEHLPENFRTLIQILITNQTAALHSMSSFGEEIGTVLGVQFAHLPAIAESYLTEFGDVLGTRLAMLVQKAGAYGEAIIDALNPASDGTFDLDTRLKQLDDLATQTTDEIIANGERERKALREIRDGIVDDAISGGRTQREQYTKIAQDLVDEYLKENQAAIANYESQMSAAKALTEVYLELKKARSSSQEGGSVEKTEFDDSGIRINADDSFQKLVDSLRSQEEAIAESYQRRKDIILANTKENSEAQKKLLEDLKEDFSDQILFDGGFTFNIDAQLDDLKRQLEERRTMIMENAELSTTEKHALIEELELQHQQRMKDIQSEHDELMLEMNGTFWERWLAAAEENLMSMDELAARTIENFANGFGNAFESMVFDSDTFGDAFANLMEGIARSSINALGQMAGQWLALQLVQMTTKKTAAAGAAAALTSEAQAASLMSGIHAFKSTAAIPVTGPAMAPAAMGAALAVTQPMAAGVAGIAAGMVGMYDNGGMIPAGKLGIVGEFGPELISGPAQVTSRKATADMISKNQSEPQSESASPQTNIRVVNVIDPSVMDDYLGSDDGEQVVMNIIKRNPDVVRGLAA